MENSERRHRPLGITIIAILFIIGGIIQLVSIILIPLSIAYFVMAYGLWKGKKWAWFISLILSGIGIVAGIVSIVYYGTLIPIAQIVINAVIIYYLYRPNVKAFFGK